jgi:hypothetical protein
MDNQIHLEEQLDSGIISQKHYDNTVSQIDAEMDRKKKDLAIRQWKREKEIRLFSAIINTAAGVTQALASGAPPYSFIMAALTAILGGIQIATISNEAQPAFKYGGYTPDTATTYTVGDGNATEWVASGDLVKDPKTGPIIAQMENYQRGRTNNMHFSQPIQPNIEGITSTSAPRFRNASGSAYNSNGSEDLLMGIHSQMQLMNENNIQMNEFLSDPINRRSTISYDHMKEYEKELSDIQSLSRTS